MSASLKSAEQLVADIREFTGSLSIPVEGEVATMLPRLAHRALSFMRSPITDFDVVVVRAQHRSIVEAEKTAVSSAVFASLWKVASLEGIEPIPSELLPLAEQRRMPDARVKAHLATLPLTDEERKTATGTLGFFMATRDRARRGICLDDRVVEKDSGVRVLGHELAHGLLNKRNLCPPNYSVEEVIAETCGFVIAEFFGLGNIETSASYIAAEVLGASLARIDFAQGVAAGAHLASEIISRATR